MAKVKIFKKDGTPTPYFWTNEKSANPNRVTVFKQTEGGVRRMNGVRFNPSTNCMRRV